MKQFFKNAITSTVHWVKGMGSRVKTGVVAVCIAILSPVGAFAQSLANTGYDAGTSAMEEVATQIAAYVPYVVNLCYALAGVVAIVGAIRTMAQETDNYTDYPMFKGLQRPLEFMGLQGRYITWAAITAAVGILGFMLVYALTGFIIGLAFAVLSISTGVGIIMVKQRRGLHSKKTDKGVFVYATLCKL